MTEREFEIMWLEIELKIAEDMVLHLQDNPDCEIGLVETQEERIEYYQLWVDAMEQRHQKLGEFLSKPITTVDDVIKKHLGETS